MIKMISYDSYDMSKPVGELRLNHSSLAYFFPAV